MERQEIAQLKAPLLRLLKQKALKLGKFTLSSGKSSSYYLDGRVITLTPEGAYLTGSLILELIRDKDIDAIGGPTLGADPIVGAIAAIAYSKKVPLSTFIVRKRLKTHGTQRLIEGPQLKQGSKALLVDDVATTGSSLIEAKAALDDLGVKVEEAVVIVDRGEGAKEKLAASGLILRAIFNIEELGIKKP
ncbi:orotate phosphoribosyltransferase [Candidatus Omnitrophota bacterium]